MHKQNIVNLLFYVEIQQKKSVNVFKKYSALQALHCLHEK